ncbi:hypothetical protein AX16_000173 [Volvariella volvacea WC 439]|nr:hypothetical protein AX16_000173 [Volvariella volvacea WC 439]
MSVSAPLLQLTHPFSPLSAVPSILGNLPVLTRQTLIGISIAITGNVIISLALNLQKLAHKRIEADKGVAGGSSRRPNQRLVGGRDLESGISESPSLDENEEDLGAVDGMPANTLRTPSARELQPMPSVASQGQRSYGTYGQLNMVTISSRPKARRSFLGRIFIQSSIDGHQSESSSEGTSLLPVDVEQPTNEDSRRLHLQKFELDDSNESDYLRSKLWWLGFLLMNVGELGNFISYAWAPASIVAPLGTFALVANCVFAPLLLGERFRKKDLFGILVAIIGAITVVLSTNASDVRFDPDTLVHAIKQTPFIIYTCFYAVGALILAALSEGSAGKTYVFVDVGLCALFGGFTVLSTKAISTLLTMEWVDMFTQWITYPTLAVLIGTGVGQIRYLNRALMRFDSKVVIPIQFVFFTLSAILGSAILYGDFQKARFHQIVTFLYGCVATFAGVYVIAWEPAGSPGLEDLAAGHKLMGISTIGRKRGSTITNPPTPILRRRQSSVSLLGLSSAQHLLLVHTPPQGDPDLPINSRASERDSQPLSPESVRRHHTQSWLGDESRSIRSSSVEGSFNGRRFRTVGGSISSTDTGRTVRL